MVDLFLTFLFNFEYICSLFLVLSGHADSYSDGMWLFELSIFGFDVETFALCCRSVFKSRTRLLRF